MEKASNIPRPFVKWAGGKGRLLETYAPLLPDDFLREDDAVYIEPFVGGGAMLFYLLNRYGNIRRAIINDINLHLIKCYRMVKNNPARLIKSLTSVQGDYRKLENENDRKDFFLEKRRRFNECNLSDVEVATLVIFLNRTCFNGLYRENSKGEFNVPFGRYTNPTICNPDLIMADHEILQRVEILHGDFSQVQLLVDRRSFVYFDPPYRPVSATSYFNSYTKESFGDGEQIRLKNFIDLIKETGCTIALSNSDSHVNTVGPLGFFEELYRGYDIVRVQASRSINADASGRGERAELLIRNYF